MTAPATATSWVERRPKTVDQMMEELDAFVRRIDRHDSAINAFCCSTTALADRDAARLAVADDLRSAGPLAGMVVAVKDNIDVGGYPTSVGSPIFADSIVDADAAVVSRLRAAGALIVGKTLLHEFVYGATTNNRHFGACHNPWNLEHVPGGSSGGSGAAVAADFCVAALGSDTGGSVRIPAALNGVSGLRPTFGSVSNRGVFPISPSFDTVGPIARTFADVWAVFKVLRGHDDADPWAVEPPVGPGDVGDVESLTELRIGVLQDEFWQDADVDVTEAVEGGVERLRELGAEIVPLRLPGADHAREDCNAIILAEALALHETRLERQPELIDPEIRDRLALGRDVTGVAFARALGSMMEWRRRVLAQLRDVDAIVVPTTPAPAPPIATSHTIETTRKMTWFTYSWSVARVPAASIPCGFSSSELPIGLQIIASPWQEHVLARIAMAFQRVTDFHLQRPPLGD